jgi:hypothetical protein
MYLGDGCLSAHRRQVFKAAHLARRSLSGDRRRVPRGDEDGVGRKHEWPIVLTPWQCALISERPDLLLRGLLHSDGCRFVNTGRGGWAHPRYAFTNASRDIRAIFWAACDLLGVRWTASGGRTIYVSRKDDVALLDLFVGPKR